MANKYINIATTDATVLLTASEIKEGYIDKIYLCNTSDSLVRIDLYLQRTFPGKVKDSSVTGLSEDLDGGEYGKNDISNDPGTTVTYYILKTYPLEPNINLQLEKDDLPLQYNTDITNRIYELYIKASTSVNPIDIIIKNKNRY